MASSFSFGFASEDIEGGEDDDEVSGLEIPDAGLQESTQMEVDDQRNLVRPHLRTLEEMVGHVFSISLRPLRRYYV